jgi:hypothetical protein
MVPNPGGQAVKRFRGQILIAGLVALPAATGQIQTICQPDGSVEQEGYLLLPSDTYLPPWPVQAGT